MGGRTSGRHSARHPLADSRRAKAHLEAQHAPRDLHVRQAEGIEAFGPRTIDHVVGFYGIWRFYKMTVSVVAPEDRAVRGGDEPHEPLPAIYWTPFGSF
eukprot:COSAG06_NODE_17866_length_917_cov_0.665037_1_plen_99_part_00